MKDVFRIVFFERPSDLRIPRSDALPLSHRDGKFWFLMGTQDFFLCSPLVIRRKTSFKIIISLSYLQHLNSQLWKFWEAKVPANKSQNNKFTINFSPKFEININSGFLRLKHMHSNIRWNQMFPKRHCTCRARLTTDKLP